MPLTHDEALAQEVARDEATLSHHLREAARTSGVHFGGMGPSSFALRGRDELEAAAVAAVSASEARAATPAGRFKACVLAVRRDAERLRIRDHAIDDGLIFGSQIGKCVELGDDLVFVGFDVGERGRLLRERFGCGCLQRVIRVLQGFDGFGLIHK